MSGTLFVVATPIGNLGDLSPRVREVLAAVDLVAAEDTRHTGRLLLHIGVKARLLAMHDHNEEKCVGKIIRILLDGQSVALVSDAGTPLLSDPGFRLLSAAHDNDIAVSPIPGASAVIAALSVAGLATDRFCFEGFGPSKKSARREWLKSLANESRTLVIFESVHRINDCLADMVEIFGAQRKAFIGRELTKMHEQCVQQSLASLQTMVADGSIVSKGEFVVVVDGADGATASWFEVDRLLLELAEYLPAKDVAKIAARVSGEQKNQLYDRLLQLKRSNNC